MKKRIFFRTLLLLFIASVFISTASALILEETLLSDSFEDEPWDANWETVHYLVDPWYRQSNADIAERVYSGLYSAASSNFESPPLGVPAGKWDGLFESTSMDTSNAISLNIEFWFQKANLESGDFNLSFWDGSEWIVMHDLSNPDYPNFPNWVLYEETITDSRFFISDFKIAFSSSLESEEVARIDNVHVSKVYSNLCYLYTYTEGRGTIELNPEGPYEPGTSVEVTAVADSGWEFVAWENALSGSANPETIIMNQNSIVTALFVKKEPFISVTSVSSYTPGANMTFNIVYGTSEGQVMLQISKSTQSLPLWADQKTLGPTGALAYSLKMPSSWTEGTYTFHVRDVEADKTALKTFTIASPVPPPPSGGGGVGGGGGGPVSSVPSPAAIEVLSPEEAAKILEDFKAADVAQLLVSLKNQTFALRILEEFNPLYAVKVLRALDPVKSAQYLLDMTQKDALDIILEFDQTLAPILEAMFDSDTNKTAVLVEEAVKVKIDGLSEEERVEALSRLSAALGAMDRDKLVTLLIEIAQLPATPSTVAYLFDSMSLSTLLDVVGKWIVEEDYVLSRNVLVSVLEFVSRGTLDNVYRGITGEMRITMYSYLTASILERLPEISEISILDLDVDPDTVTAGEEVTVSFTIRNSGNQTDDYVVAIRVDDLIEELFRDIINAGEEKTVIHRIQRSELGPHTVNVNGNIISFQVVEKVVPPEPTVANLIVTGLTIVPSSLTRGENVNIFVTVKNEADETGTKIFDLLIDSIKIDSKSITITGWGEEVIIFTVKADYPAGSHVIKIGEKTLEFSIAEKQTSFPWITIITILMVLSIVGIYMYRERIK